MILARLPTKNYSLLVCMPPPLPPFLPYLPQGLEDGVPAQASVSCSTLLVTTFGHEATEVPTLGALSILQDTLLHSPVLLHLFARLILAVSLKRRWTFPTHVAMLENVTK